MNKRRFHGLGISTESHEEPIIIGAEQDLITVKDALSSINEGKDEVDDTQLAVDELTEAKESLEAMAVAVRQQIRDGGMSPTVAQTQQAVAMRVLGHIGMDGSRYTISHESFAHDPIGVSLEAERSLKEAVTEIVKRIWAALTKALQAIKDYLKKFSLVGKSIAKNSTEMKKTVAAIETEKSGEKIDVGPYGKHFHIAGKFDGNVAKALNTVLIKGLQLSNFAASTRHGVDGLLTHVVAGNYAKGDYEKAFEVTAKKLPEGNIPGGYTLEKDGLKIKMTRGAEYQPEVIEIPLPLKKDLNHIVDEVEEMGKFIGSYGKELADAEASIEKMMSQVERHASNLKPDDTERADAIKRVTEDMNAIIAVARGCGPDYIRYVSICSKEALNFVIKCAKQHSAN